MPKHATAFYAFPPDDEYPYERVGHFLKEFAPEGAREIDEAEAQRINDEVTKRTPAVVPRPALAGAQPDLSALYDEIAKLQKIVIDHAGMHDQHAKAIDDVREKTASAIAQIGDLGDGA